ncbi:MAG: hypothetical protein KA956_00545 [Pyrinomonadaceae bacterium]|nr:hypothetical protein [Pyrinomonadaceae bacterium]
MAKNAKPKIKTDDLFICNLLFAKQYSKAVTSGPPKKIRIGKFSKFCHRIKKKATKILISRLLLCLSESLMAGNFALKFRSTASLESREFKVIHSGRRNHDSRRQYKQESLGRRSRSLGDFDANGRQIETQYRSSKYRRCRNIVDQTGLRSFDGIGGLSPISSNADTTFGI